MHNVALVISTTDTLKKPRLKARTDRAWFSCILRHPARKRSGSILSTPEPARGRVHVMHHPGYRCMNDLNDVWRQRSHSLHTKFRLYLACVDCCTLWL